MKINHFNQKKLDQNFTTIKTKYGKIKFNQQQKLYLSISYILAGTMNAPSIILSSITSQPISKLSIGLTSFCLMISTGFGISYVKEKVKEKNKQKKILP